MGELTLFQFLVALSMSLAALSFFLWAVLSGHFKNVEDIKYEVYRMETEESEPEEQVG